MDEHSAFVLRNVIKTSVGHYSGGLKRRVDYSVSILETNEIKRLRVVNMGLL